jgi:two-component system, chemotaxis family, protein-glutamate methylesterase/glutaminase
VRVHVAICDDSPTYALALARVLCADDDIDVVGRFDTAERLLAALPTLEADLVTMDLELPGMDGIEATRRIMARRPMPVVVLSSHADEQGAEALAAGAVDVLRKDAVVLGDADGPPGAQLRRRIRRLSGLRVSAPPRPATSRAVVGLGGEPLRAVAARGTRAIAIAASTGGPSALRAVLAYLPQRPEVAVLVVQHMTAGFTDGLARWLDRAVAAPVRLAGDGVVATPGVWLAPDGAHLTIDAGMVLHLDARAPMGGHRPAGDVLFVAMARSLGADAVVVVLTGMGDDGARGVGAVVATGGLAIAQDPANATVVGMPRAAVAAGAQVVLELGQIGPALATLRARPRVA